MSNDQNQNSALTTARPDPYFKFITRLEAMQIGLLTSETELQYSTRTDLVLTVPPGLSLKGTLFDFFRSINVIEFKSQSDPLNLREYVRNELRTDLILLQSKDEEFNNILNVLVVSRFPQRFLDYARSKGIIFEPAAARPWLWRNQVGFQNVVIVVCRDLPLEPLYYPWLIFAPTDSRKWREFVLRLLAERNAFFLEKLENMRPKEYKEMAQKFIETARAQGLVITPEEEAELEQAHADALAQPSDPEFLASLEDLDIDAIGVWLGPVIEEKPEKLVQKLAKLTPEQKKKLIKMLGNE